MDTATTGTPLKTIGDIARESGVPKAAVEYAVESDRIPETQRVGIIRAYDEHAVRRIRSAFRRISERRGRAPS